MSGATWIHISEGLLKRETEFDRIIRAAQIRDIRGRTDIGPDLSTAYFIISNMDRTVFEKLPDHEGS